jgi:hypothetical protein
MLLRGCTERTLFLYDHTQLPDFAGADTAGCHDTGSHCPRLHQRPGKVAN